MEPHEVSQNWRSALVVMAWVLEGPLAKQWVSFRYAYMREFETLPATFSRREMPPVLTEWRGPRKALGVVRLAGPLPGAQAFCAMHR